MKKFILKFLTVFIAVAALLGVSACADNNDNKEQGTDDGVVVVANFEQWEPDFQLIRVSSTFGRVTRNENTDYVKSGKYSALIQPLGGYTTKAEPVMRIPLVSGLHQFNYSDFRWYDEINCSVYSVAGGEELKLGLLAGDGVTITSGEKILEQKFTLEKGWNELSYKVNASLINLTKDARYVNGICFTFQNAGSRDLKDAPLIYIDDVTLTKRTEEAQIVNLLELRPYEICDFEKLYQEYILTVAGNANILPELSVVSEVVTDNKVIKPTSGSKMLKAYLRAGQVDENDYANASLNYIQFPNALMSKAFANLTDAEIENGVFERGFIEFDVYGDRAPSTTFHPQFFNQKGELVLAYYDTTYENTWKTFRIPLKDMLDKGILPANKFGSMSLVYREFKGQDRTFYFDNFRIVP